MSEFSEGERVRITRPDTRIKYSRVDYGYVTGFSEEGRPIVEFNYKFLIHVDEFDDNELELV